MDFVTLDFETANSDRGSPCAAGLVRFRGGVEVASWFRLMRPPQAVDWFHGFNIAIHHITAGMVADEPRFAELWPEMLHFVGDDVVVAHNAAFDIGVMRRALTHEGIDLPTLDYVCTMRAARRTLDLLSYSLPWVTNALGITLDNHHDALADARACGAVLVSLAERVDAASLFDFGQSVGLRTRRCVQIPTVNAAPAPAPGKPLPVACPAHALHGLHVTFTGGLDSMTRSEAWECLATVGGVPEATMNKRTNVLVVGPDFYRGEVLGGDLPTGKMARAAALRAKGQPIEIMSEDEFLRYL